eukprot:1129012-Amphidinium_carterae.1
MFGCGLIQKPRAQSPRPLIATRRVSNRWAGHIHQRLLALPMHCHALHRSPPMYERCWLQRRILRRRADCRRHSTCTICHLELPRESQFFSPCKPDYSKCDSVSTKVS